VIFFSTRVFKVWT